MDTESSNEPEARERFVEAAQRAAGVIAAPEGVGPAFVSVMTCEAFAPIDGMTSDSTA